jgi:SAM-dependent methyltransferase
LNAIKNLIPLGKKGIEVGIGSGLFAKPLKIKEGVEPSEKMRKLAKQRGLQVIDGIGENLPLPSENYDFALMVTTICFLDDVLKSFGEINRILKPGGSFIIGFVDKNSPLGKIYQKHKNENPFYRYATFYSTGKVVNLLEKQRFTISRIIQTVFGDLSKIDCIQKIVEGYGEGGFVCIEAKKEN